MFSRFVQAAAAMTPHALNEWNEQRLPPARLVPSAQVIAKILRSSGLADEDRQSSVSAGFIQKAIDETRLLLHRQLALPQLIEITILENAARGKVSTGQGVADPQPEKIILKAGRFTDKQRAVTAGALLQMKVHVRVAGPSLGRQYETMNPLRSGQRVIEVFVDAFEVGDDRASERRSSIKNEQIRVTPGER